MNSSRHAAAASHIAALAFLCVGFWGAGSINAPVWAGTAVYAGTFVMKLNITIKSALAANQSILCDASLNSIDASTGYSFGESAAATAVRGANNTATCTITIPYRWLAGGTGVLAPTYTAGYSVSATSTTGTSVRLSSGGNPGSAPIPANGATTHLSFDVTF